MDITDPHKVLILFGSDSDKEVYNDIVEILKKNNIQYTLKIASAHRTPDFVDKLLREEDYSIIIAGAGLSAALPGTVAAKTIKPVIGVPCKSNYQGFDALLSVIQLPPGIPVLAVGVNQSAVAANATIQSIHNFDYVNIIGDSNLKPIKKCMDMLVKFDQEYKFSDSTQPNTINIKFIKLGDNTHPDPNPIIYCPMSEDSTAEAALNLLKMTEHGLWVGLNRGENAALAALQLLNLDDRHTESFDNYRIELKSKVTEANK